LTNQLNIIKDIRIILILWEVFKSREPPAVKIYLSLFILSRKNHFDSTYSEVKQEVGDLYTFKVLGFIRYLSRLKLGTKINQFLKITGLKNIIKYNQNE